MQPVRFTVVSVKGYSSSDLPFYSDGNIYKQQSTDLNVFITDHVQNY